MQTQNRSARRDDRIYPVVCNVVIVVGLAITPLIVLGILPSWIGSGLFLFALMWIGVRAIRRPHPRRDG